MNQHIKDLIEHNKNLKLDIKDAVYDFEKELKTNTLIIKYLKELSNLFGEDSIIYNYAGVNSDQDLLAEYNLDIPVNTNGVKYKLNCDDGSIEYIFYYNIKGKLILVNQYEIYYDNCYYLHHPRLNDGNFYAKIADYSIFSTAKIIENKILKRIKNCCNQIADHCIKNNIELSSEKCFKIKFSGYNEELFSDYQDKYFKTLALFE